MALKINNKVLVALDKASNQFSNTVFDAIKDERGVHLETAISAPCFLAQMKKDKTPREQHAYVAALTEMKILRMGRPICRLRSVKL
jgi:hypothetical protein